MHYPIGTSSTEFLADSERDSSNQNTRDRLRGWAGIEHHMIKHDSEMVKDYTDDIDTLLVFAGLFSAVVTAFVIETYSLLQPDPMSMTNQLLFYGFASNSNRPPSPNIDDFTASLTLSPPQPYVASISARWINSLFFVSLVLSLSAAFFGILAKQWLREYMHWYSSMDPARRNVLVRQARFEAWEAWNVAATISTIPAFLELAMILYLIGIVILLWTLDNVVATVITIVVATFLGTAGAFTVLPLLCKRCPYKSPTAWALYTAWELLCATQRHCRKLWKISKTSHLAVFPLWTRMQLAFQSADWLPRDKNWRNRDLNECQMSAVNGWQGDTEAAWKIARLELVKEEGHLTADDHLVWPKLPSYPDIRTAAKHVSRNAAYRFMTDLSETALLWRALTWMRKTSQDARVSRYIDQSIATMHHTSEGLGVSYGSHTLTDWCIVSSLVSGYTLDPLGYLLRNAEADFPTQLRKALRVLGSRTTNLGTVPSSAGRFVFSVDNRPNLVRLGLIQSGPELYILLRLLSTDLQSLMEHLQAMVDTREAFVRSEDFEIHVRRVFELTNALLKLASYSESSFLGGPQYMAGLYSIIACRGQLKSELESLAPGLRLIAFRLACRYAKVSAHQESGDGDVVLAISDGTMGYTDYECLLLNYFSYFDLRQCSDGDIRLFIASTIAWISIGTPTPGSSEATTRIIGMILNAVGALSARRTDKQYLNCSSVSDWLEALAYDLRWKHGNFWSAHGPSARRIFHHFETLHNEGFLGGDTNEIVANLHSSLSWLHEHIQVCEVYGCKWASHACPNMAKCEILTTFSENGSLDSVLSSNSSGEDSSAELSTLQVPSNTLAHTSSRESIKDAIVYMGRTKSESSFIV